VNRGRATCIQQKVISATDLHSLFESQIDLIVLIIRCRGWSFAIWNGTSFEHHTILGLDPLEVPLNREQHSPEYTSAFTADSDHPLTSSACYKVQSTTGHRTLTADYVVKNASGVQDEIHRDQEMRPCRYFCGEASGSRKFRGDVAGIRWCQCTRKYHRVGWYDV
jgi:hypothetical protein